MRLGNPARVADDSEQMRALAEEHALAARPTPHISGFAAGRRHSLAIRAPAIACIREGYELSVPLGMRALASEARTYAAEALANAGDWAGARQELEEAMQCADAIGEREYLPQLLVLDARIADALGEAKRARESIRQAIAEARAQEAPWLELAALSALCERPDVSAKDFAALAHVVEQLTEGLDTAQVARARELLKRRRGASTSARR